MADPSVIASLLLERCSTLSVGSPVLPIAMPEVSFTPPVKSNGDPRPYLRVSLFSNAPFWEGLSSGRMDQGLLQITVVWPENQGIVAARRVAAQVMAHFPKGLMRSSDGVRVKINREPWAASPIPDEGSSLVPITVSWVAT